jgi:hypothetical protein
VARGKTTPSFRCLIAQARLLASRAAVYSYDFNAGFKPARCIFFMSERGEGEG